MAAQIPSWRPFCCFSVQFCAYLFSVFFFIITLHRNIRYKSLRYQNIAFKIPPLIALLWCHSEVQEVSYIQWKWKKMFVYFLFIFSVVMVTTCLRHYAWNVSQKIPCSVSFHKMYRFPHLSQTIKMLHLIKAGHVQNWKKI